MRIDLIPAGDSPPDSLNVLIEVPIGGEPVKYEFDKASGALFVDRFLHTPMRYPANYGFVPHTLGEDGDPLDALVVARSPIVAGAVVKCRPIGVLKMVDDAGGDEKMFKSGDVVAKTQSAVVLEKLISQFMFTKASEGPDTK